MSTITRFTLLTGQIIEVFDRTVLSKPLISTFTVAHFAFSSYSSRIYQLSQLGVQRNHLIEMILLSTYTEQQYTHSNIIQQISEDLDRAGSSNILISVLSGF